MVSSRRHRRRLLRAALAHVAAENHGSCRMLAERVRRGRLHRSLQLARGHCGKGIVDQVRGALHGVPGALLLRRESCGPGIAAEEMGEIFNPFIRGDRARGGKGTGLGLAIVKRIASLHGGSVELRNRAGGGMEARVCLPLGLLLPRDAA